jgi:hypothetical protein
MTVHFHVAIQRGIIESVYTDEQFYGLSMGEMLDGALPPNVSWCHVTVVDESAKAQWLDAMQTWQEGAYAPETAREVAEKYEEQYERARTRKNAQEIMDRLEADGERVSVV